VRPLRFGPCWIAVGWLLVAGLVSGSLVAVPDDLPGFGPGDKLLHVGAYLLVMAWFVQVWSSGRVLLGHALFLVALGVLLELLQGAGGYRTADHLDALANGVGIVLGWLTSRTKVTGLLRGVEVRLWPPSS